jgi:hypothetical protein
MRKSVNVLALSVVTLENITPVIWDLTRKLQPPGMHSHLVGHIFLYDIVVKHIVAIAT